MKNKNLIIVLAILGVPTVLFSMFIVAILFAMGAFDKDYSVTDLKNNYFKKEKEIAELIIYYKSIVPENRFVEIEFENDKIINRFGITETFQNGYAPLFLDWDLEINNQRTDSVMATIGWNTDILQNIKRKLDNANCIGIENGEHITVQFQRSGMGMYSFNIFEKPMNDSLKNIYNDSCYHILVNEKLALEYGGGVFGPQCFDNFN
jgi:hypothetical protein